MIAAIVSSLDFISVGPNTTPRLLAAIKFLFELAATLRRRIVLSLSVYYYEGPLLVMFGWYAW